ncbi:EmrB/QacA subfamily drug resistance transporter [Luteibacter rhizovicinus]|uniref:EmrB/QacA subfamily drug resistance transporter n=1 Tax=Luteibacter rhizovicinus TaxID=242606 RepID=A0A4R3YP95_9GAMM|nr:MFS transporter [Luteibacter rhizovicinus]TCV94557.1 EmrB/QacA subfamily drug resistance transporter [Luteibacter rhizovicinus]
MSQIGKPPCDDGAIFHGDVSLPCSVSSRRWTLVAAVLGSGLAFIDGTVVNVALPSIQQDLGATTSDAQWVIESYALFLASLLLVGGVLGDRFGRRRIFMIGIALFALSSIGCSLSVGVGQLIAARAVQGIGAALLVPGSLALISATFPQSERGAAIGTWSAFSGITAAIGPVIGGFLVEHYSWIWAFLINVPIGIVLLLICMAKVPESRGSGGRSPIDAMGACLATIGLAGVVFALIEAPSRGWLAAPVWMAACIGIVALVLFVWVEGRSAAPMLPLSLFRERNFAGANLLTLLLYAALGGSLFFLPLNLIQVQGYGATFAGAALLPFIAIMFFLSRWAGTLVDVFGPRLPLVVGPIVAAFGFGLLAVPSVGSKYWTTFFPAICVLGFGMTVTIAPLTTTVMNALGPGLAGTASGINNAVSRAAGLLAIAIFGIVLTWAFNARLSHELASVSVPKELVSSVITQRQKLAGIVIPGGYPASATSTMRHAIDVSFVSGFRWVMLASAALALLSAISAWILIAERSGRSVDEHPGD